MYWQDCFITCNDMVYHFYPRQKAIAVILALRIIPPQYKAQYFKELVLKVLVYVRQRAAICVCRLKMRMVPF